MATKPNKYGMTPMGKTKPTKWYNQFKIKPIRGTGLFTVEQKVRLRGNKTAVTVGGIHKTRQAAENLMRALQKSKGKGNAEKRPISNKLAGYDPNTATYTKKASNVRFGGKSALGGGGAM